MDSPDDKKMVADDGDFTRSLRMLVLPADEPQTETQGDDEGYTALLFCRDATSRKWGPRWLAQSGFAAVHRHDGDNAVRELGRNSPHVVIVDAAMRNEDGSPLYLDLVGTGDPPVPVVVLCNSTREMSAALDAGAHDVVRKPFEWRLIAARSRQAAHAFDLASNLATARLTATQAIDLADSARQRLRSREAFEPLTGLPNKSRFIDLIKRGMGAVERDGNVLAVFVIGFARFRLVVEAMGQERADLLLTEIGYKLNDCLQDFGSSGGRPNGLWTAAAASLDGPRFGVMLTCGTHDEGLTDMQQRLLATMSQPVQVSSQIVDLSACVGVALYPQDANAADTLLQRAENAMREAQSHGGGFRHYCQQSDAAAARKLRMEHMLHEAIERNELQIAYQPINETESGDVAAAEALLRWPQPDGSFISPEEFAPVAEECGLMIRLGEFVLDGACRQLAEWNAAGMHLPRVCVNVSKVQLMSSSFVQQVADVLARHSVEPAALELEISERGVLSGSSDAIEQLHALRELGVRLSIDDFGTGDSAIAYLKELPVDCLKIDRSYIGGMDSDSKDAAIVSAMVAMSQRMGLVVVAEGVETEVQLEMLRELDCHLFQGFIVSRPVFADKFRIFLEK